MNFSIIMSSVEITRRLTLMIHPFRITSVTKKIKGNMFYPSRWKVKHICRVIFMSRVLILYRSSDWRSPARMDKWEIKVSDRQIGTMFMSSLRQTTFQIYWRYEGIRVTDIYFIFFYTEKSQCTFRKRNTCNVVTDTYVDSVISVLRTWEKFKVISCKNFWRTSFWFFVILQIDGLSLIKITLNDAHQFQESKNLE